MSLGVLALQRARKQLDAFCLQHSTPGGELSCQPVEDSLLLHCEGQAVVKIQLNETRWHIFWQRDDGQWIAWPHLPVCDDIQQVIEQLDQAPLHVHWGG
ncbi:DUF3024 family protein [Thiogranum longum]|uniref:DUF3024 family protein n=1 Tax=Thiogranum longum TaxID=1537524 RepID=A0A4R1HL74_9GAMM|nr:DUF3024 domain-containing protein [Thiogranum longum]TCK17962.1 DUF3024 family protein [Thiogranum longum]